MTEQGDTAAPGGGHRAASLFECLRGMTMATVEVAIGLTIEVVQAVQRRRADS